MAEMIDRLMPEPSPDSAPYWDGLRAGKLMLQRCGDCGTVRHYPRPMCSACHSMEVDWIEAGGRGTVHSWAVSHHAFHPSFKGDLPLVLVTVDLEEGVRLCAPLRGAEAEQLAIGRPVVIDFEALADDLVIPIVRLDGQQDRQ